MNGNPPSPGKGRQLADQLIVLTFSSPSVAGNESKGYNHINIASGPTKGQRQNYGLIPQSDVSAIQGRICTHSDLILEYENIDIPQAGHLIYYIHFLKNAINIVVEITSFSKLTSPKSK